MTQIHVRNGTMCTKETNGYHFCCIVKLSFMYTNRNRHNQTIRVSVCVLASCDFLKVYMHVLDQFQTREKKIPLLTVQYIPWKAYCEFYPFKLLCMYCSFSTCGPFFLRFFLSHRMCFVRCSFFPFCHVLCKCQCAEYDVVRVCMTPTQQHAYVHISNT